MAYEAKNFDSLLGTPGFSDQLLKNHFTLYQGYVANTNKIIDIMRKNTHAVGTPEYNELTRRFGWEWNGMRLHELYFGNMVKGGKELSGELKKLMENTWGSFDNWKKDFNGCGMMRGIGWVILAYDKEKKMLFNTWINEHDTGHLAGAVPLLVMDVFEHAFMIDYGLKKADYIEAFFKAINWNEVSRRFK